MTYQLTAMYFATAAITSPVAGFSTSNLFPDGAGTHLPPMKSSVSTKPSYGSVRVDDDQILGREQREDSRPVGHNDDLLLDARRGEAVGGRAIRLEREHHPRLQLDRRGHAVQPR